MAKAKCKHTVDLSSCILAFKAAVADAVQLFYTFPSVHLWFCFFPLQISFIII